MEKQPTCKLLVPTSNGCRSGRLMAHMSSMSEVKSSLFSNQMLKQPISELPRRTETLLNTGRSFTAVPSRIELPVSTSNSDSRSTSHSSSSLRCTWDMLSKTMVTLIPGTTRILLNNGSSMKFQRLSNQFSPQQTHLVLTLVTDKTGCCPQLTQDGTNS